MVSGTKKSTAIPSPKQKSISPQTLFIEKQLPSILFYAVRELFDAFVAFRAKCKIFSRHLQKPILKTEKGRFKGL